MKVRVRRFTWAAQERYPIPGAYYDNGKGQKAFIPGDKLRTVADQLHDIADELEQEDSA